MSEKNNNKTGQKSTTKLGELMVTENLITPVQLQQAIEEQKKTGGRLGTSLVKLGYVSDEDLAQFLSKQYDVPHINLKEFEIEPTVTELVPLEIAEK